MVEDSPPLDSLVTCVGGGGLCAGIALALGELSPNTKLYGAEPVGYDDHRRSLAAGERVAIADAPPTLCDAIMTPMPGELTWSINSRALARVFAVTDEDCLRAMRIAWETLELRLEPGGAAALAAVLNGEVRGMGRVGVVLSGGNVDEAVWRRALGS